MARLRAQNLLFSAKITRNLDFQILKLARLKAVNKTLVPTCVISFKDPKVTSPMISKHSDASRLRNAPFFGELMVTILPKILQNVAYTEENVTHCSLHCQIILFGCLCDASDVYGCLCQLKHQCRTISNAPKPINCYLLWTKCHIMIIKYASSLIKLRLVFERTEYTWIPHSHDSLWFWRVQNYSALMLKLA